MKRRLSRWYFWARLVAILQGLTMYAREQEAKHWREEMRKAGFPK